MTAYRVRLCVDGIRNIDMDCMRPSASLQVVWEGLRNKKQTMLKSPTDGTALYEQEWILDNVIPTLIDEAGKQLSIGLWLYNPGEDAQYVGSGLVDISDFHVNLEQNRKFEMAVTFMEEKVELTFSLSTTQEVEAEAPSTETVPQQEPGRITPAKESEQPSTEPVVAEQVEATTEPEPAAEPEPEPEPEQPKPEVSKQPEKEIEVKTTPTPPPQVTENPTSPTTSLPTGTSPPRYDPDPQISSTELRSWLFAVLSEIRDGITGEDRSEGTDLKISSDPTLFDKTITQLLDEPHSKSEGLTVSVQAVEERLLAATLEVYMRASENGSEIARQIRTEMGDQLLSLLCLPKEMQRRVFLENGMLTTELLHQIQNIGLQKVKYPRK